MINYPAYKKLEDGKYISLQKELPNEGDEIDLECVSVKIVDAKDTQFGCNRLSMTVKMDNEERLLEIDSPDEKNEFQGSQVYRGIKDNNIQPGDKFVVGNGGRMNNQYKTVIYGINKDITAPPPDETPPPDDNEPY